MKKFISILPAVILAALVMTGMDAEAAGTFNTIENGVFIGDIDVSGMTTLEAEDAVNSYVDGLKIRTRSFRFLFLLMRQQSDPLSRKNVCSIM